MIFLQQPVQVVDLLIVWVRNLFWSHFWKWNKFKHISILHIVYFVFKVKALILLLFLPYIQNRQENTSVLLCFELLKNSCVSHRKRGEVESIWWNMHLCNVDHPRRFFFSVLTVGTKWDKWKWNMHLCNVEHPRWFFFCVVGASPRPLDVHFYLKLSFILGKCWWQICSRWNCFPFS